MLEGTYESRMQQFRANRSKMGTTHAFQLQKSRPGYAARHHLADHAGAVRFEHAWACIEELGLGRDPFGSRDVTLETTPFGFEDWQWVKIKEFHQA